MYASLEDILALQKFFQNRIVKIIQNSYPEQKQKKNKDDLLLCKIKYLIFMHVYRPSYDVSPEKIYNMSAAESVRYAHYVYLSRRTFEYIRGYKHIREELVTMIRRGILLRVDNDKTHPLIFALNCIVKYKELHIRRPKQSPANVITKGSVGDKNDCFNSVNGKKCMFGRYSRDEHEYQTLIFTPASNDLEPDVHDFIDNEESYCYDEETGEYRTIYNNISQFCVVVSIGWGKLFRLLHNIIHINNYISACLLSYVSIKKKNIEKLPWDIVWGILMEDEKYVDCGMNKFKKTKDMPECANIISQINNVITGETLLIDKIRNGAI